MRIPFNIFGKSTKPVDNKQLQEPAAQAPATEETTSFFEEITSHVTVEGANFDPATGNVDMQLSDIATQVAEQWTIERDNAEDILSDGVLRVKELTSSHRTRLASGKALIEGLNSTFRNTLAHIFGRKMARIGELCKKVTWKFRFTRGIRSILSI